MTESYFCQLYCMVGTECACSTACENCCQVFCESQGPQVSECQNSCEQGRQWSEGVACATSCELNGGQSSCTFQCQTQCQSLEELAVGPYQPVGVIGSCQTTCEQSCQEACQGTSACQTQCQYICEWDCELICELENQGASKPGPCQTGCEQTCQYEIQGVKELPRIEEIRGELSAVGSERLNCLSSCEVACTVGCETACQSDGGCQILVQGNCAVACETTGCQVASETCPVSTELS